MPPCRQSWAFALGLIVLTGCGPVIYLKEVNSRTAVALAQAKAVDAARYAPYELAKAELYYEKARIDAGRANFQDAIDWGRRSQDCSRRAAALSRSAQTKHGDDARPSQSCGEI